VGNADIPVGYVSHQVDMVIAHKKYCKILENVMDEVTNVQIHRESREGFRLVLETLWKGCSENVILMLCKIFFQME